MIELRDASVGYAQKPVLEHVSLAIGEGDYVVLLGENGCGKSTLLKTMLGIVEPLSGTVVRGFRPCDVGYLTQLNPLRFDFPATCAEIITAGLRCGAGTASRQEAQEALWLSLTRMGIEHLENADYRHLSGGQRQRVLIARALAAARTLLVLDEPTNELDADATSALFDLLRQLNEGGMTIVMVSHDKDALQQATRLVGVADGRLVNEQGGAR